MTTFSSPAKVTAKKFGYPPSGMLMLAGGRLSFTTRHGVELDVPVEEVRDIRTPRLMLGEGFTCVIEGRKYTITFVKVDMGAYDAAMRIARDAGGAIAAAGVGIGLVGAVRTLADMGHARELCDQWLTILAAPSEAAGSSDTAGAPIFTDATSSSEGPQSPAAAPARERICPNCGTSFTRASVQCPKCGEIVS